VQRLGALIHLQLPADRDSKTLWLGQWLAVQRLGALIHLPADRDSKTWWLGRWLAVQRLGALIHSPADRESKTWWLGQSWWALGFQVTDSRPFSRLLCFLGWFFPSIHLVCPTIRRDLDRLPLHPW
jgi:hypothetical protein